MVVRVQRYEIKFNQPNFALMKVIEMLKLGQNWLEMLQKACIKIEDVRHIEMYEEYKRMIDEGGKKTHAVAVLVDVYHVSERQVYYIIRKFEQDCKICACGY